MLVFDSNAMVALGGPLDFVQKWLPTVGWPAVVILVWKARGVVIAFEKKIDTTVEIINANHTDLKNHVNDVQSFKDAFQLVEKQTLEQAKKAEELAKYVQQFMEQAKHQTDVHSEEFKLLRGIAEQQSALAANQTNITNGMQRVVEQLISMMKE